MGRIAIVTGGASGLGRFITQRLSAEGAHVLLADIDSAAGERLAARLQARGGRATFLRTDASDPEDVHHLIHRAAELGETNLLVNNAGGWLSGPQFPDGETWSRSLDLNLRMPMLATQLCLPVMRDSGGGAVVNIASSAALEPVGYGSPEYAAAKAGLIRFTTAVRGAALRSGVRVNCMVPHWIGLDRAVAEFEGLSPQQRAASGGLVDPERVTDVVLELSRDPEAAGRVTVLRAGCEPYDISPAAADPLAGS
jgi:NAD(P)-dependent dehydrogenase (short-subunit alcohol dehydrogenase family)